MSTVSVHQVELEMIFYLAQSAEKAMMLAESNDVPRWVARSAVRFADRAEHVAQYALPGGLDPAQRLQYLANDYEELSRVLVNLRAIAASAGRAVTLPSEHDVERLRSSLLAAGVPLSGVAC